jgi:hypothetical protein
MSPVGYNPLYLSVTDTAEVLEVLRPRDAWNKSD